MSKDLSPIWANFNREVVNNGGIVAKCNECNTKL